MLNQTVRTELLHSTDFGLHWTRVSPGAEFIPLGPEGAFDSYTTYSSWSGGAAPLLDPKMQNRTLFYYSGGDGPHDGQRDDSIGLAYAPTHGYAGLRHIAAGAGRLRTLPLELQAPEDGVASTQRWHVLATLGAAADGATPALRARTVADTAAAFVDVAIAPDSQPHWAELELGAGATGTSTWSEGAEAPAVEFECEGTCTIFALRVS